MFPGGMPQAMPRPGAGQPGAHMGLADRLLASGGRQSMNVDDLRGQRPAQSALLQALMSRMSGGGPINKINF